MTLPKHSDRMVIYGPTGSGKTYLAQRLLELYTNVVKIDFKHHLDAKKSDLVVKDFRGLIRAMRQQDREPNRHIIYRVPKEELLAANSKRLDRIPALAMERGNTLLYYDDVVYVASATDFQVRAPQFYFALTVGRGKGVGVWSVSQRPSRIPVSIHTESDVRVTFNLRRLADRKAAEESFGTDEIPWDTLRKYPYTWVMGDDQHLGSPTRLTPSPKGGSASHATG